MPPDSSLGTSTRNSGDDRTRHTRPIEFAQTELGSSNVHRHEGGDTGAGTRRRRVVFTPGFWATSVVGIAAHSERDSRSNRQDNRRPFCGWMDTDIRGVSAPAPPPTPGADRPAGGEDRRPTLSPRHGPRPDMRALAGEHIPLPRVGPLPRGRSSTSVRTRNEALQTVFPPSYPVRRFARPSQLPSGSRALLPAHTPS